MHFKSALQCVFYFHFSFVFLCAGSINLCNIPADSHPRFWNFFFFGRGRFRLTVRRSVFGAPPPPTHPRVENFKETCLKLKCKMRFFVFFLLLLFNKIGFQFGKATQTIKSACKYAAKLRYVSEVPSQDFLIPILVCQIL